MKNGSMVEYVGTHTPALFGCVGKIVRTDRKGWIHVDFGGGHGEQKCADVNLRPWPAPPPAQLPENKGVVWILNSALPDGNTIRPISALEVFTDEASARAAYDKTMRDEWEYNAPCNDDGDPLPYPGDPDAAHEAIVQDKAKFDVDEPWGQWTLTRHEIAAPPPVQSPAAMALLRDLVAWEHESWDDEDGEIDGGDAVEFLGEFRQRVKALLDEDNSPKTEAAIMDEVCADLDRIARKVDAMGTESQAISDFREMLGAAIDEAHQALCLVDEGEG